MSYTFFRLSSFDKKILTECPSINNGVSFIQYLGWFQIFISLFTGWVGISLFNWGNIILNIILSVSLSLIHIFIFRLLDMELHKYRQWKMMMKVVVIQMVIAFFQTFFIGNFIFKSDVEIYGILHRPYSFISWIDRIFYFFNQYFYIFSFENNVVSVLNITLFFITSFIGILPFGLTFFYRKSKYYDTLELIENFKTEYEYITEKQ